MRCRKPFHGCGRNASAARDRYTKRCVCASVRLCLYTLHGVCVYLCVCGGYALYICREKHTTHTHTHTHTGVVHCKRLPDLLPAAQGAQGSHRDAQATRALLYKLVSRGSSCRRLYLENLQHLTRSGCRRLVETGRWRNVWHHSLCPWKPHKDGGGWSPFRGKRPQKSDAEGRWAQGSRVGEVQPSEHHRVDLRVTTGMAQRRHRAGLRIYPSNGLALMRRGRVMERFIPL